MTDECSKDGDCATGTTCWWHRISSVQFSPSATPSRRNNIPPPQSRNNSWEKGLATDSRGMPYLGENGKPIGLKDLANNRHKIEGQIRDLHNTQSAQPKD